MAPGRVWLVLEDGYLMQRVPPVINLEAAQGSLPSWTRPPIHQLCQQTTDKVCVCSSEAWGGALFSVVWTNKVIQHIQFPWNCMKDSPIGTNLTAFCTKSVNFSSRSATITAALSWLYHFMINPWLQIKFLSLCIIFNDLWMLSLVPKAILGLHLQHEPEQLYFIWIM